MKELNRQKTRILSKATQELRMQIKFLWGKETQLCIYEKESDSVEICFKMSETAGSCMIFASIIPLRCFTFNVPAFCHCLPKNSLER